MRTKHIFLVIEETCDKYLLSNDRIGMFVKLCVSYILPLLVNILNSIFVEGDYPYCWKQYLVTPTHKKISVNSLTDFRQISNICGVSKLTENIMDTQLRNYLGDNNILTITQSGFRPGYSSTTAMQMIIERECTTIIMFFQGSG